MGFLDGSVSKESACNVGELGSIPGLGKSPGGGLMIVFSHLKVKVKLLSPVWLFVTLWTVAYQAPLSTELSR